MGYLLAALFYRALVPTTSHGWRSLFWFGAGPPVLIILFRLWLPETNAFQVAKAEREAHVLAKKAATEGHEETAIDLASGVPQKVIKRKGIEAFIREAGRAVRAHWFLFIYMIVLMSGFNACSHGSQDFYPTFLKNQAELGPTDVTVITVVGQIGTFIGAMFFGHMSSFLGRRLTMMVACIFGGALIPAYILPRNMSLVASAFFEQMFVGAVWGPIPIYLIELSPPELRTLIVGLTYQLGNLASSASATIQGVIGERHPLPPAPDGTKRFDYGTVIAQFMGGVFAYQFFFIFWGPEMTESERMELQEEAESLEQMRASGVSLREIGENRVKVEMGKGIQSDVETNEKKDESVQYLEQRTEETV